MECLKGLISKDCPISIRKQCELLEIHRSSIYYQAAPEKEENLHIMRLMDEHHLNYPTHGVLQMQDFICDSGIQVNPKRIRRLLRKMGIMAIYPKQNLSKLLHAEYIRPYLLKGLNINRPRQVWAIDITYIPMKKGFMYLTAIIDVYSRFVVGWDISNSLSAENSLAVLKSSIQRYGQPEIINSDQGSQFTCALWTEYIEKQTSIKISMDGKGRAIDNIFIERFWRTLKQDYVYLHPADNGQELFLGIGKFIDYYNYKKKHQGIKRQSPVKLFINVKTVA